MFKGWRTLAFNGLLVLAAVAAFLDVNPMIEELLPAKYAWMPLAIGVVNVVLRAITTTPIGKR